MPYATPTDLLARYSERELRLITDQAGQQFDVARAQGALDDASDEIDTYLGQRYLLPLRTADGTPMMVPPKVLVRAACDVAVYRLKVLRPADDIKDARQRYDDVIKLMVKMAKGEVGLDGCALRSDVPDTPSAAASAGQPRFETPPSVWARETR